MHYSFKSTPTWTFKYRTQSFQYLYAAITFQNQGGSRPGPSDYKVKKPMHRDGTFAVTKQQRNLYKKNQEVPPPGYYPTKSYITDGPKRSMSARYLQRSQQSPGPHEYNNDTLKVKNKAPLFSMSNKSKSSNEIITNHNTFKPAPSAYQSENPFHKNKAAVLGTSIRKDLTETEKTPAPNYYSPQKGDFYASTLNPRCKMGGELRNPDFSQKEKTPGPDKYSKQSFVEDNLKKKKGYSCRQKNDDLISLEISKYPGPGKYESHFKNKIRAPRCTTSQSKRKTFTDDNMGSKMGKVPGPADHHPDFTSSKFRSTSANFGKSSRRPLDENQKTPGPAQYVNSKASVMHSAPKYSSTKDINKNSFLKLNPQNPGPGYHNPNMKLVKNNSSMFDVPKEKRPSFDKYKYTPGPGYYNLRGKQQGPTWKFSSQKRLAFTDHKNQMKEGKIYEIPSKIPDPPKYMNVQSKVKYEQSSLKSMFASTAH